MNWWIWILIGFLLLATEFVSLTLHIGFFAVGAFVVGLLELGGWNAPLWQELLVFTVTSLIAFFFIRPMVMKKFRLNEAKTVDSLVGEQATAMDDIAVEGRGRAELRGATWSAQNVGTNPLVRGQRCTVERVEGLLLHIRA